MGMWRSLHPFHSEPTTKRKRSSLRKGKTGAVADARKSLKRRALLERFEERAMLSGAPQLISIVANSGDVVYSPSTAGQTPVLHTSPIELDLLFNQGTVIDPTTLGGIQVVAAGLDGKLNTADDVAIQPGFVGMGNTQNSVVLRFSQTLADGSYEITLLGTGPNALTDSNSPPDLFNSGNAAKPNLQIPFTVDNGPHVVSVVPEPVSFNPASGQLQQNTNEIDVYFDKPIAPLPQTVNQLDKRLFQLIVTNDTANTTNQTSLMPSSVSFDYTTNKATLLFGFPLDVIAGNSGALRLRIGNNEQVVTPLGGNPVNTQPVTTTIAEPGSTFGDSSQSNLAPYTVAGLDGTQQHQILQTVLGASNVNPDVGMPGGNTGIGVRSDPVEQHIDYSASPLGQAAFAAKPAPGTVPTYTYNFPDIYGGTAPSPLHNVITSDQENLTRQIFQLWSNYLGVQFKEVSDPTLGAADFGIVTGEVQAVDPTVASTLQAIAGPAPTSPNTINGVPEYLAVMNAQVYASESLYGGPWFTAAMQQIGRLLGLGYDGEGPPGTVMGLGGADPATGAAPEPVFPGNTDILHAQSIYQPKSDNVDVYSFTLHSSGQFSAETIAQRGFFNVITIPSGSSTGGVGSAVVDGSTFSISDGSQTITFEFAADGRTLSDGNTPIAYNSTDSAETVAADVAAAVNKAAALFGLKASAGAYANQVDINGPISVTPSAGQGQVTYSQQPSGLNSVVTLYSQSNVIQVPESSSSNGAVGSSVVDGSTFTINDGTHPQVTFEFAANGRVLTDGNTPIAFSQTQDNAHTVAVAIANAINQAAAKTGLIVSASVQFDQVVLSGPVTVTHSASQGGVTYTVSRQVISRNDDYFGSDSFVRMDLTPGVYYVAVTSTGNTQFDPNVASSGLGGTTQGPYDLKLDFTPNATSTLTDLDGNPLIGNSDGTSGGAYNFWFNVGNTIFVDKTPPAKTSGPLGSVTNPYTAVNAALQVAADRLIAPGGSTANLDGQTFVVSDGQNSPVTFEFAADGRQVTDGNVAVDFNSGNVSGVSADPPDQVAADIAQAIQSEVNLGALAGSVQPVVNGKVVDVQGASFVDAKGSPALMASAKIVRILGTGIGDNSIGVPATDANGNNIMAGQIVTAGQSFTITSGTLTSTFEFVTGTMSVMPGAIAVRYANTDTPARLAQEIAAAINASPLAQPAGGEVAASVGANATAYTNGDAWFVNLTGVGQLVINAQNASGTVTALGLIADSNAAAYQIGHSQFGGGALADGSDLSVPQDVTVMIDAGAVFKLEGANVSVGVNSPNVDRSQSALQVLGTPTSSVFFTSFHDNAIGQVTDTVTSANPGDWGGIVFGSAADIENQGIFLDNVNHARITYAGGTVVVDGQQAAYAPIYLAGSRPTITNNTILKSLDSALSADPNSFAETIFGSPANAAGALPAPVQSTPTSSTTNGTLGTGTYYYVVTAIGAAGETVASNETSVAVTGPTGEVTLNWYAVAGATGYKVYRGTASGAENVLVGTVVGGSTTSFVDGVVGAVVLSGQQPPVNEAFNSDYERAGPDISGNTLAVTQAGALTLTVPGGNQMNAPAGNKILAGETFLVTNPNTAVTSVFEFVNSVASPATVAGQLLSDGHYAVLFSPGIPSNNPNVPPVPPDKAAQVATKIAAAIQAANIGVTAAVSTNPTANGTQVTVSGASSVVPSTPSSFAAPAGTSIVDGETFVVVNLTTGASATFEFDNNGSVAAGNVAVTFTTRDSAATVAAEMTAAIDGAGIGVSAITTGPLVLLTGATDFHFVQNSQAAGISLTAPAANAIIDGTTFQIADVKTGSTTTFQYHLNSVNAVPLVTGNIPIVYSKTDNSAAVAAEIAAAINGAGLGVSAVISNGTVPSVPSIVSLIESPTGEFASPLGVLSNVVANTVNGLFVRTQDVLTQTPETLSVSARWTATDIPYVLSDNLVLQGNPGGVLDNTPRLSGRLDIDPGATVKLNNARIETQIGANLIAEGTASEPIVFTSLHDNTFGGGGTFETDGVAPSTASVLTLPSPGDWAGFYFAPVSRGSLDHVQIAYAGGTSTVQGNADSFDAVEIHQANVRIADSVLENNGKGLATASRGNLQGNDAATIYVLGAQPAIVNNTFVNNLGATISINVDSLTSAIVPDPGRSTGPINRFTQFDTNDGPLVRLNKIGNVLTNTGAINGMLVRGGTLDTQSVWDDTDIVSVVETPIAVPNVDSRGGLLLKSDSSASLVVKFSGAKAGLTATGTPLDITNRVGGSVQVLGTPQHNVVLTSLGDETVGAGLTPDGRPNLFTDNGVGAIQSGQALLPTVPYVPNGTTISNDVAVNVVGHFEATPGPSGELGINGLGLNQPVAITGQGRTQLLINQNVAYEYYNYVDIGNNIGLNLASTTITQQPTLVSQDTVVSKGTFPGKNGTVNWVVTTSFKPGTTQMVNQVNFSSSSALGTLQFINYLDEDVPPLPGDDLLYTVGTPGQPGFQVFTVDGPERVGLSQSGVYLAGPQLVNATYAGWASDTYPNLRGNIANGSQTYSIAGNINTTNDPPSIDPQLGRVYGPADQTTAFAWNINSSATNSTITTFLNEVAGAQVATAGPWNGITLDQYSNDTNVATVNESEPDYTGGVGTNDTVATAQPLGQLAPNLKSGDDNQRLGFVVNGTISPDHPSDVDVYSFTAQPGTQVWMSLGNTSPGLDSVLELVDRNGTVLARSDNAADEALNPSLLTTPPPSGIGFTGNLAQPLASSPLLGGNYDPSDPALSNTLYDPASLTEPGLRNLNSTNPHDAGFRVVLPVPSGGTTNGTAQYFIRVRSRGADINNLQGGLSSGAYQLTVGLQEAPLVPGSSVQYADIRFATNGITVQGLPDRSPLLANAGQVTDGSNVTDASSASQPNPLPTAQNLGNLLATDQNSISVSGSLAPSATNSSLSTQVDWYSFTLNYDLVQLLQGSANADKTFSTIFDVDYANGLQRANTTISVYNSAGQLIYVGRDSNVADDQTTPASGNGLSDLTHGSSGQLDPYIGSVQLPAGEQGGTSETYYVAISSDAALPQALDGTFIAGSTNAAVRLEPIDSVNRVVEDHIGSQGGETAQPASSLTPIFNGTVDTSATNFANAATQPIAATSQQIQQITSLNTSAVPWTLGDVQLFVDQQPPGNTQLPPVNPKSGELFSINLPKTATGTALKTDIGALPGTGLGYDALAIRNDGELYGLTYDNTDATAAGGAGRYDLISTGNAAATVTGSDNLTTSDVIAGTVTVQNVGVQMRTMTYVQNGVNRQLFAVGSYQGGPGSPSFSNGLYELDPNTGAVIGPGPANVKAPGTNPFAPVLLSPAGVSLSEKITGLAALGSTLYAVTNQGGLYIVNAPTTGAASVQFVAQVKDANGNAISFTGLTNGPPDVSNGAYANDLFGVDATGKLYAFNTSGALQSIFNGASSVSLGVTNITSLTFSTLDYNLWHVTDARADDTGHGINMAPDNSRNPQSANQPQAGNLSYYFGLENPAAPGVIDTGTNTTLQPGAANYATATGANGASNVYGTYNLPGGALGSLQTNSFSLSNYSAGDKPTLYFNYFLDSGITASTPWKSSARVLVSTDGGQTWDEVATNDPTRNAYNLATDPLSGSLGNRQNSQTSELPGFDSASSNMGATSRNGNSMVDPRQQVQQLFDGTGAWRQARIDLSNYAGQGNIMLRFDFSSAGSMNQNLVGDKFGNFTSNTRGQNNGHEGFYVDDLTVGFAERGEMVTGNTANTNFFATPQSPNANAPTQNFGGSGPYQLDIRHGTEYGVTLSPTAPDISLVHSFDTNDRLTDGFTIVAPAGSALVDGATFQISDASQHTVTFEFHLTTDTTGVATGHVAVPYQTAYTPAQVAASLATAINANTTLVGVRAGTVQNTINGAQVVTGNRVDLFGVTNLTSTQALLGTLTVSLSNHTLVEGTGDTSSVTVSRPASSEANPVFVTVSATDVGGGASQNVHFVDANNNSLGTTVTVLIPAGQATANLRLQEEDQDLPNSTNPLADGPQKVLVTATAANYGSNADTLDVVDNPAVVPTLTLTLTDPSNGVILENAGPGAAHAMVTRNTPTNVPLTVTLTSLDPASASVPATVVIPAGQASVTFPINAIDDNILRSQPVNVVIVASAENFLDGTTSVAVQDDGDTNQAPLATPVWTSQGPAPITGGQTINTTSDGLIDPVAGDIDTVLTVPNNPNVIYAGTVNGGVWKTTDGTDPAPTWVPLTDSQPSLSIGAMQFDPTDSTFSTILVGVGRFSNFNQVGGELSGLMFTKDGGASWSVITPSISSLVTPVGQDISGVAERGNVIMAATTATSSTIGLMRSTDGGQTFTLVSGTLTSGLPAGPISDLVGDPLDPNRFYAAVLTQGIYTSDDAGATWTNVTPSVLTLNASPTGDNIRIADSGQAVYFGYEKFNSATNQTALAALYRSPAVGVSSSTWTAMDLPTTVENSNTVVGLNPGGQGALDFSIAADPNNPNIVYVGGDRQPGPIDGVSFPNSVGATNYTARLFRGDASKPTGSQWTPITDNFTANDSTPHADSRDMTIDSSGRLLETDGGGIYTLSNPTTSSGTWTSLIGSNLQITEIHNVAYDTLTDTIISGNEDTGISEQPAANAAVWATLPVSAAGLSVIDGGDVAIDDSNAATTGQSIRYTSASKLADFQATTYDANNNAVGFSVPQLIVAGSGGQSIYKFDAGLPAITTVKLNALAGYSNRMVIGGGSAVYESFDDGQTLTPLRDAAGNLVGGAPNAQFGASMAYGGTINGQANPDVLWVGVGSSVYLRSSSPASGGVLTATNYTGGAVVSLTINSNNWRNAFIVDANGHVWSTVDGGVSYQDITGNLTVGTGALTADLHSVAFVPGVSTNLVYVGARDGVYQMQTSNPGVWTRYGAFMPDVPVFSLQYVPSQQLLVAGTLGRGAFTASAINAAGDITVTLDQQTVTDDFNAATGTGVITGTVTRQGTFGNLIVNLQSSDPTLVPNTPVTIPDGQSSATFTIQVNDPTDSQGGELAVPQETVIITPQAAGLNSVGAFVNVTDTEQDDQPQLTVTLSQNEINTNLGVNQIAGVVSRNTATDQPLTVTLVSSDPARASVPTTVTIPAGQSSAPFVVSAVDQFLNDGQSEWVTITAYGVTSQGLGISSANGDGNDDESADGAPDGDESFTLKVDTAQHLMSYNRQGDSNVVPLQGQIVIQDNRISNSLNYGIVIQAAPRDAGGSRPYPGVPMNYQPLNTDRVVPGATVTSNLLVNNTQGGINLVGDSNSGNGPLAVVPIARILNNTIYGSASQTGTGINVGANASPTILNNILAGLATGVSVDPTSASTVLNSSVYQNNGTNLTGNVVSGDQSSYALSTTDPLFANAANNDFYLALGSKAIDSGTSALSARGDVAQVDSPLGIAATATNAPTYDLFGQLRTADPQTTPNGVGSTLFKDRGAIERVDYTGPTSTLANPIDNGSLDQDPTLNVVHEVDGSLANFAIQLNDTGTGIDDSTVTSSKFDLYRNGVQLVAGIDYFFQYDTNTKTVYLVPATGTWATGATYTIFVDNGVKFDANSAATPVGTKDLAGNLLQANSSTGYTRYDILLQSASGDAPTIGVPPVQSVNENGVIATSLIFSSSATPANAITIFDIDAPNDTVTVTLQTGQGTLSLPNNLFGVTISGNGTSTLTITGAVPAVNAALGGTPSQNGQPAVPGLIFTPTLDFRGAATINVSATDPLLGSNGLTGTNAVQINVLAVNQPPVVHVPAQPLTIPENSANALVITSVSVSDPDFNPAFGQGVEQVTITVAGWTLQVAPGATGHIIAHQTLTVTQGTASKTFEFVTPSTGVAAPGNIAITLNDSDGPAQIAAAIAATLNGGTGFNNAGTASLALGNAVLVKTANPISTNGTLLSTAYSPTGTVSFATTSGLTFSQGAATGSTMTFSGTLASINSALNGMRFTPANNFSGLTSIHINVNDQGNSPAPPQQGSGDVPILVTPVNQPPQLLAPIPTVVVNETNTSGVTTVIDLSKYIDDPDEFNTPPEAPPTFAILGNSNTQLVAATINGNLLTLTYVPYASGNATITILALDGNTTPPRQTLQTSFSVIVNPIDYAPTANNDGYVYTPGEPLIIDAAQGVLANDVDHQSTSLQAHITQAPQHGGVTLNLDGSFTYQPNPGFTGTDSFSYRVDNGPNTAGSSATVFLSSSPSTNPQKNVLYVTAVYEDVLGRAPDSNGLAYWVNLIDQGAAISSVAESIAHSAEYYANFVIKPDYLKLLGRAADATGIQYWTAQMQAGLTDQQLEAQFAASNEFYNTAGGTNLAWVDAVYKLLLGRTADAQGESYWTGQLAQGVSRLQVAEGIAGSTENNTQIINDDYFHYLGRAADPNGLAFWLSQFAEGKTNEDVIAGFTGSQEYYDEHTS